MILCLVLSLCLCCSALAANRTVTVKDEKGNIFEVTYDGEDTWVDAEGSSHPDSWVQEHLYQEDSSSDPDEDPTGDPSGDPSEDPSEDPSSEPAEPKTMTILVVDEDGNEKPVTVTKVNDQWLDEDGNDWTEFVKGKLDAEHLYEIKDYDNPEYGDMVKLITMPTATKPGILRVRCTYHPDDDNDVKEYQVFLVGCKVVTQADVTAAWNKGGKAEVEKLAGFVEWTTQPDCGKNIAGVAKFKCTYTADKVQWERGKGFVYHPACTTTESRTVTPGHVWSDDPDVDVDQRYHDVPGKHPTCSEPGELTAYCVNCGIDRYEVEGEDAIIHVDELNHYWLHGTARAEDKPAYIEVTVREANCKQGKVQALYCQQCQQYLTEKECQELLDENKVNKLYPFDDETPNGMHVVSPFQFDAWKLKADRTEWKPTCTERGWQIGHTICSICKTVFGTEEREVAALGHTFEGSVWQNKEDGAVATCTEGIDQIRYCTRTGCGKNGTEVNTEDDYGNKGFEEQKLEKDPYNHYDKATKKSALILQEIVTPATCTKAGLAKYFCTKCNQLVYQPLPKTNHNWVYKTYDGWCGSSEDNDAWTALCDEAKDEFTVTNSYTYYECSNCHAIKDVTETVHSHNFTDWEKRNPYAPATETEPVTLEYWVRYCVNEKNGVKCGYHQDWIAEFALADGETPPLDWDGVTYPEPGDPGDPEDPQNPGELDQDKTFTVNDDAGFEKTGRYYDYSGTVTVNDPDAVKYAYVRVTRFYFDKTCSVTFTSVNLETGEWSFSDEKPIWSLAVVVMDNNKAANMHSTDESLRWSNGGGNEWTEADYE